MEMVIETLKRPIFGMEDVLDKLHKNHGRRSKVVFVVEGEEAPFILVLENGKQVEDPNYAVMVAQEAACLTEQYSTRRLHPVTQE